MILDLAIQEKPIALGEFHVEGAGGLVRFEGRVRGEEQGAAIRALNYEAYRPMAERQMEKIVRELAAVHPVLGVRIRHRIGAIPVGEAAIVVEVAAKHRAAAFALAAAFMDRLKEDVPIWKTGSES
jgi:molybdopterin synthase catalytic subunit